MEEINLKGLESVPHKQMIAMINQYIVSSTDTVNKMAFHAQEQMMKIDDYIEYIENKVMLLEAKLASAGANIQLKQPQQKTEEAAD